MSLGRPPARAPTPGYRLGRCPCARVAATAANPGSTPSRSRWYSSSTTKARTQLRGPRPGLSVRRGRRFTWTQRAPRRRKQRDGKCHMVTLRSAAPPDAGDVARVHVRSWQAAYRGLLPADFLAGLQPTDWAAGYTFDAQDPVTTVAVDSRSGIVGFATVSITPPLARLMALYVDPDLRGHGIGSQLLKQAMDSFRTAGCTVAELWVMDGNERAQHFYRSHGWHPVAGHKRENVRGIEVDEVCFQAAL